jgi:hydrogenase-4 component B
MILSTLLACVAVLLALAPLAVLIARWTIASRLIYAACMVATAISLAAALTHLLLARPPVIVALPVGVPWLGAHLRLDALSAFFLLVVDLGAMCASFFALGYGEHESAPGRVLPFFPAFLASMNLVVLADDALTFLLSWESMSLTSWALVISHHRVAENMRAGYIFILMASFGTLALLLAFGLLAGADGLYTFAQMRAAHPAAATGALVLLLVLLGAGSKAGLVPLHVWLPLAHPAAPSHVSALMSGVMTKVAVYGFVRIVFDLAGAPSYGAS